MSQEPPRFDSSLPIFGACRFGEAKEILVALVTGEAKRDKRK